MNKNVRAKISGLTIWILFIAAIAGGAETRITAKGMSFFEPGREMVAREKALDQAKRAAVEKAVGTTVESRFSVENSEIIRDQILSHSSGYLKNIKIIEDRKTELGTYEVTIEADVKSREMAGDIDRFQALLGWQKNPRISVVIDPNTNRDFWPAARKSANFLSRKLSGNGFTVISDAKSGTDKLGLLVELSVEHATKQSEYQGLTLTLNEVSLSARIIRPGDRQVLATSSEVKSVPGENRLRVMDKATRECVQKIWKGLSGQLARIWQEELYGIRDILLVVKAVKSHERALVIEQALKSDISGIADVRLVRFEKKNAEYTLKYRGWPEQFIHEIGMSYFRDKYFKSDVEGIRGNTVTIRIDTI